MAPGDREGLVEQLVLIVSAGEAHDLAESAGLNELTNVSICRVLGVVKANVVNYALLAASSASSLDSSAEMDSGFSQYTFLPFSRAALATT